MNDVDILQEGLTFEKKGQDILAVKKDSIPLDNIQTQIDNLITQRKKQWDRVSEMITRLEDKLKELKKL